LVKGMIDSDLLYETAVELLGRSMLEIPSDALKAYRRVHRMEKDSAKSVYDFLWMCRDITRKEGRPLCGDSGTLCFFLTIGTRAQIDPELDYYKTLARAVRKATGDGVLQAKIADPITRENLGTNCGINMPSVEFNFVTNGKLLEVTVVPKGGGAEIFGSNFRMMVAADGLKGVKKFVVDSVAKGCKNGKTCPPCIFGIGIGGTSAIAAKHAMAAATLRPIGARHPVRWIAKLERELTDAINALGIGPMGHSGSVTALDVHIEYSWGHPSLLPVAIVTQCFVAHRATAQIASRGQVHFRSYPEFWFAEERRSHLHPSSLSGDQ
jgi:fumarate hydratase subunit alpha